MGFRNSIGNHWNYLQISKELSVKKSDAYRKGEFSSTERKRMSSDQIDKKTVKVSSLLYYWAQFPKLSYSLVNANRPLLRMQTLCTGKETLCSLGHKLPKIIRITFTVYGLLSRHIYYRWHTGIWSSKESELAEIMECLLKRRRTHTLHGERIYWYINDYIQGQLA